jgi:hypothetical protein
VHASAPPPVLSDPLSDPLLTAEEPDVGDVVVVLLVPLVSGNVVVLVVSVGSWVVELVVVLGLDVGAAEEAVALVDTPVLPVSSELAVALCSSPAGQPAPAASAAAPSKSKPNRVCMGAMITRQHGWLIALAPCALLGAAVGCGDEGPLAAESSTAAGSDASTATSTGPDPQTETGTVPTTSTGADPGWEVAFEVDESVGAFLSVWGVDDNALYVVGGQEPAEPGPTTGAMARYDGASWTIVDLPPDTPKLNWVFGVGEDRFAVGEEGTVLHRVGDDDATPWQVGGCDTNLALWGVWGATPDDVWAVGGDGFSRPPVLCRYDGTQWTVQELPPVSVMSRALFKVWGASADAVWAVGHRGLIVHFDGNAWSEQASGTELDLISLWGTGPEEILAVGGRADSVVVRWDGSAWQPMEMFGPAGLNGIWMADDGAATIVGTMGRIDTVAAGALEPVPDDSPTMLALHAVFGTPPMGARHFAVGGSFDLSPPFTGVVLSRG